MHMRNTNTGELRRFSVCMPATLVDQLDDLVSSNGFSNRSQALTEMVRSHLVDRQATNGTQEIAGTITLVYDHHKRDLQAQLTDIQHDHQELIIAAMHVHLDHHRCLEVLTVRGTSPRIRKLADRLLAVRGVMHGRLTVTVTTASTRRDAARHRHGSSA